MKFDYSSELKEENIITDSYQQKFSSIILEIVPQHYRKLCHTYNNKCFTNNSRFLCIFPVGGDWGLYGFFSTRKTLQNCVVLIPRFMCTKLLYNHQWIMLYGPQKSLHYSCIYCCNFYWDVCLDFSLKMCIFYCCTDNLFPTIIFLISTLNYPLLEFLSLNSSNILSSWNSIHLENPISLQKKYLLALS